MSCYVMFQKDSTKEKNGSEDDLRHKRGGGSRRRGTLDCFALPVGRKSEAEAE